MTMEAGGIISKDRYQLKVHLSPEWGNLALDFMERYNSLLDGCAQSSLVDEGLRVLREMEAERKKL